MPSVFLPRLDTETTQEQYLHHIRRRFYHNSRFGQHSSGFCNFDILKKNKRKRSRTKRVLKTEKLHDNAQDFYSNMPAFRRHFMWPSKRDNYPVYRTGAFIRVGTIFFLVAVTLPSFEPCTCRFFNSENNNNNKKTITLNHTPRLLNSVLNRRPATNHLTQLYFSLICG